MLGLVPSWHSDAAHLCGKSLGGSSTRNHFGQSDHDGGSFVCYWKLFAAALRDPKEGTMFAEQKDGGH